MQWLKGRKTQRTALRQAQGPDFAEWIWFHAASLGEFEQGRPVIEALKKECPQYKILLSFFSPSGYEIRKDYPLADEVLYLPSDTPNHAAQWVQRHHFVAAFFIKYEFWFNYMQALKDAGIPLFYISLILKPDSYFFRWYGTWFFRQLKNVTHFFVQDDTTAQLLQSNGMTNVTVCGDTRFDRVAAIPIQWLGKRLRVWRHAFRPCGRHRPAGQAFPRGGAVHRWSPMHYSGQYLAARREAVGGLLPENAQRVLPHHRSS